MTFRLLHRTNHQGLYIRARTSNRDDGLSRPLIWTQAMFRRQFGRTDGCCRSFGDRIVYIDNSDFTKELFPDTDKSNWHLYFVKKNYGYNRHHLFLNFLVSPCDYCDEYLGSLRDASALQDLARLLTEFCKEYEIQICSNAIHLHVGLEIPKVRTDIDTQQAEDEYYEEVLLSLECDPSDKAIEQYEQDKYEEYFLLLLEYDQAVDEAIEQYEQDKYDEEYFLLLLEYDQAVDEAIEQYEQDKYDEEYFLLLLEYDQAVDEAIEQHEQDKYDEEVWLSVEIDRAVDKTIEHHEQDKYDEEVWLSVEIDRAVDKTIEHHEQDKYEEEVLLSLEYDRAVDEAIEHHDERISY